MFYYMTACYGCYAITDGAFIFDVLYGIIKNKESSKLTTERYYG